MCKKQPLHDLTGTAVCGRVLDQAGCKTNNTFCTSSIQGLHLSKDPLSNWQVWTKAPETDYFRGQYFSDKVLFITVPFSHNTGLLASERQMQVAGLPSDRRAAPVSNGITSKGKTPLSPTMNEPMREQIQASSRSLLKRFPQDSASFSHRGPELAAT